MNEFFKTLKEMHKRKRGSISLFLSLYGKVVAVSLLLIFILSLSIVLYQTFSHTELTVSFLDVGQGDAILVTTPSKKQILIDGGATHKILEELSSEISYFDRSLDVVIATHPDADHVTGLIPTLVKYDVSTIITSPMTSDTGVFKELNSQIESEGADVRIGKKGDTIDFGDGVVLYILYPGERIVRDTNDASVSVVIIYKEHSFLLTGDLSQAYEPELIQSSYIKNVTVYKAGHHGSNTSSGEQLLSYTKPEYAVISAGKDNTYGHPHKEVLKRLSVYAKETFSTIDNGRITFTSDGKLLTISTKK